MHIVFKQFASENYYYLNCVAKFSRERGFENSTIQDAINRFFEKQTIIKKIFFIPGNNNVTTSITIFKIHGSNILIRFKKFNIQIFIKKYIIYTDRKNKKFNDIIKKIFSILR